MSVSGQLLRPHVTESYVDGEWPDELLIEQNHVVSGQLSGAQPEGAKQFETGHSDLLCCHISMSGSRSFLWTHGVRKTRLTLWRISQRSNRSEPFVVGIRLKRFEFTLCIRSLGKRVTPKCLQWLGLIGPWRSSYHPRKSALHYLRKR